MQPLRILLIVGVLLSLFAIPSSAAPYGPSINLVKDLHPLTGDGAPGLGAPLGSRVIYTGNTAANGSEPYVSDGTAAGTKMVKDIVPGAASSGPTQFTPFKGKVFFQAGQPEDRELWFTNGTAAGTNEIDLNPDIAGSSPAEFVVAGSKMYFVAKMQGGERELYVTDGTALGTHLARNSFTEYSQDTAIETGVAFGEKLIYAARYVDPITPANGKGQELFISDGTIPGTYLLKDINPGTGYSNPQSLIQFKGKVYFNANNGTNGAELWKTDGTFAGTTLVKNIALDPASSNPKWPAVLGDALYFSASRPDEGNELWATDGTSGGTQLAYEIVDGPSPSTPRFLTTSGNTMYFTATDATHGEELWRTKGTVGSTILVKDIVPNTVGSQIQEITPIDGIVTFQARDEEHGKELWRSDGTEAGTTLVADVEGGPNDSFPVHLTPVFNTLFFRAGTGAKGIELYSFTTRASSTRGYPKSSYKKSVASKKKIYITVKVAATGTTPTGKVTIKKGSKVLGTGNLSGGRVSIRLTTKLGKGTHSVRAYYAGSVRARYSTSATFKIKVK